MKSKTLRVLDKLDDRMEIIKTKINPLNPELLGVQPNESEWSILQVVEHLRQSEKLAFGYVNYKISQKAEFEKAGVPELFRHLAFAHRLKFGKARKAPNVKGLVPENKGLDYNTILNKWKEQRNEMKSFFKELDDSYFRKQIYKQPGLGKLSLKHMLQFFCNHTDRHMKQIDRILNQHASNSSSH